MAKKMVYNVRLKPSEKELLKKLTGEISAIGWSFSTPNKKAPIITMRAFHKHIH